MTSSYSDVDVCVKWSFEEGDFSSWCMIYSAPAGSGDARDDWSWTYGDERTAWAWLSGEEQTANRDEGADENPPAEYEGEEPGYAYQGTQCVPDNLGDQWTDAQYLDPVDYTTAACWAVAKEAGESVDNAGKAVCVTWERTYVFFGLGWTSSCKMITADSYYGDIRYADPWETEVEPEDIQSFMWVAGVEQTWAPGNAATMISLGLSSVAALGMLFLE